MIKTNLESFVMNDAGAEIAPETLPARERLLRSAIEEFAEKGLAGARTNEIAQRANINKQALFHYFGSKEGLYTCVLEKVFRDSRSRDLDLNLDALSPVAALESFVGHVVKSSIANPHYQRLLIDANWYQARHMDAFETPVRYMGHRVEILRDVLRRGVEQGVFQDGIDARELYMTILGAFSIRVTNAHSLSRTLGADLLTSDGRASSHHSALQVILGGIRKH